MTWLLVPFLLMNIPPASESTPNKEPQMVAANGVVSLVYGSGHAVMFAQSKDNGETFSKPVTIAEVPMLMLTHHRGPRIAVSGKTLLVSAIGVTDGDLLLWRSSDNGKTWSKGATLNDVPKSAREGLHTLAADGAGNVAAAWLDLRMKGTRLFGSFSKDGGATWSKNVMLYESPDGTICQCCDPTLLATGKGEFAVMFRNALGGNRDMYLLRVRDGVVSGKAEKLGEGSWKLDACPMDGGGLAASSEGLLTAWRRGTELYLARPGQAETKVGTGVDIAVAAGAGKTYAVWNQAGNIEALVSGKTETIGEGAFPSIIMLPDGSALAAWESSGAIHTRRIR